MIQKELLNELSKQIIAGTLETGKPQVIDVFDGKIVLRKPIDEKEKNGNGARNGKKAKASAYGTLGKKLRCIRGNSGSRSPGTAEPERHRTTTLPLTTVPS
jgi:hypothetical protein